jgi:hypothetical protein
MANTLKNGLLAFTFLFITLNISNPSFAEETIIKEKTKAEEKLPSNPQKPKPDKNAVIPEIVSGAVSAKVVSIDINVDKEQKSYIVKCLGSLQNKTNMLLKNVRLKVKLMDTDRNLIEEVNVNDIDIAEPGKEKPFKLEKFVSTKISPFELRAMAQVTKFETTNMLEVAKWFLSGKKEKLKYWSIPFNEDDFQNESTLRASAIRVLQDIDKTDANFVKAKDMLSELRYIEGLKDLSASDYSKAFINLASVAPNNKYSEKAETALSMYRPKMLLEKAKSFLEKKDFYNATMLLKGIPTESSFYNDAQRELKKIIFLSRTNKTEHKMPELKGLSDSQTKILNLMEDKPETILNNFIDKNVITWIFPDYSYFNFDKDGNLVTYKVYPLY